MDFQSRLSVEWIAQLVEHTRLLSIILLRQNSAEFRIAGGLHGVGHHGWKIVTFIRWSAVNGELENYFLGRDGVAGEQGWTRLRVLSSSGGSNRNATHLINQWTSPGYMYDSARKLFRGSIWQSLNAKDRNNLTVHGSFGR